jgi:hypothetical protein
MNGGKTRKNSEMPSGPWKCRPQSRRAFVLAPYADQGLTETQSLPGLSRLGKKPAKRSIADGTLTGAALFVHNHMVI